MIYEHFQDNGAHDAALDLSDLFNVSLPGHEIQDFGTELTQLIPGQSHLSMQKSVAKVKVISKVGTARSGLFSTDTEDECSSSG